MKLWSVIIAVLMCLFSQAHELQLITIYDAPEHDALLRAVLFLTGAADAESIPESEMERWWALADSPIPINLAGRTRLEASGLMSPYQIASLDDYRSRHGDILSIRELASVDGFGQETAEAMSMFISLESHALPGKSSDYRPPARNYLYVNESNKVSMPLDGTGADADWSWTGKYRVNAEGRFDTGIALRKAYGAGSAWPSAGSGYVAYYGRRHIADIYAGDYALRFGQGLALWTGFSMSGVNALSSFWKRPSGISPTYSLSGTSSERGLAAGLELGRISVSVFAAFPGLRGWMESGRKLVPDTFQGVNVAWYSRHGQVSATFYGELGKTEDHSKAGEVVQVGKNWCVTSSKISADARFCIKGVELFGEAALDICSLEPAATAGFMMPAGDNWKTSLSFRYIPDGYALGRCAPVRAWSGNKGETGIAAGVSYRDKQLTADFAMQPEHDKKQVKVLVTAPFMISGSVNVILRLQERWRNYGIANRADFRSDVKWNYGSWQTVWRAEVLISKRVAVLGYVDEGYEGRIGAVFLRGTMFMADSWDDRIYVYERDAPGSFNVPAYYGRGYALSAVARLKFRFGGHLSDNAEKRSRISVLKTYLRAGFSDTPWLSPGQTKLRPARAELKMQLMYDF